MFQSLHLIRKASTQSINNLVKPPILFFGIEGQYVNALYSAAAKSKKLDKVDQDLKALTDLLHKDVKFKEFITNPLVSVAIKKEAIDQALKQKLNFSELTTNLVELMAENHRLTYLPEVARCFGKAMAFSRNEITCTVTTALPITDPNVQKDVEDCLKKFTSKKLTIIMKNDPSIIGGMIIDFDGENYIDMSLRSKLKVYSDLIKTPI